MEDVIRRLCTELASTANEARDAELLALANPVQTALGHVAARPASAPSANILVPVTLRRGNVSVDLLTPIITLGPPPDITMQELRIETFFPPTPRGAPRSG